MNLEQLRRLRPNLERRAALFSSIRRTFTDGGFLEVETDTAIPAPAPEEFIESIPAGAKFLRASPEIAMKIMVCAGYEKIFQIGRCFRAEEYGSRHREEFTMLEYYATAWDYRKLADFTAEFIRKAADDVLGNARLPFRGMEIDLDAEPEWITVEEAFQHFCGISAAEASREDRFDELMVTQIEPELGKGRMTFLADYPAERASLARLKPEDPRYAERWELYIAGLELANAFGELVDPVEQRSRFEAAWEFRRSRNMLEYPVPEDFFAALQSGMPFTSGGALGLDRLVMVFCNAADIAEVRAE